MSKYQIDKLKEVAFYLEGLIANGHTSLTADHTTALWEIHLELVTQYNREAT